LQSVMAKNREIPVDRESILQSQTLLIVGAGGIGGRVMKLAKNSFGEVLYTGGRGEKQELREAGFRYIADFAEAFSIADAVSIHLALIPATEKIITVGQLAKMPKNGFLLNNARAGIISSGDMETFLFNRPDVQIVCDEFYVNGEEFRKKMYEQGANVYQNIIGCDNFWYTGHTANQGEMTKREYSEGVLKILSQLGLL